MLLPRARAGLAAALLCLGALAGACGGDDDDLAGARAEQVRAAAVEAGLPAEVADLLALAGRGASATFRVTYGGEGGSSIVVSQRPPDRRIDVVLADQVLESRVLRDGVGYACAVPSTTVAGGTAGELTCERRAGDLRTDGTFTEEALTRFTEALVDSLDRVDLRVERREIAGTTATCLVTSPKAGTPLTGTEPGAETLCLSPEGVQLLVDSGGEEVEATAYGDDVPDGTFDVG